MIDNKVPYDAMNATEKTAYIGFKVYSDRELKDKEKKAKGRQILGVRKFLTDLLANPDLELGKDMDEQALEKVFRTPINDLYQYAIENDLSSADLQGVMNNIMQIGYMFKRTENEAIVEIRRLSYALTGENNLAEVSLKNLLKITQVAKESKTVVATEYDNEPSLSQTAELVTDIPEVAPEVAPELAPEVAPEVAEAPEVIDPTV